MRFGVILGSYHFVPMFVGMCVICGQMNVADAKKTMPSYTASGYGGAEHMEMDLQSSPWQSFSNNSRCSSFGGKTVK